jgi:hypothetical protein
MDERSSAFALQEQQRGPGNGPFYVVGRTLDPFIVHYILRVDAFFICPRPRPDCSKHTRSDLVYIHLTAESACGLGSKVSKLPTMRV